MALVHDRASLDAGADARRASTTTSGPAIFAQPVDEGAHLRRHRLAALPRVGRHARHLDGLREAGGRAPARCRCSRSPGWSAAPAGRCKCSGDSDGTRTRESASSSVPTRRKFDVVIVGAGGSGHARVAAACARRPQRRRAVQGVPDPLAHGRGAGRHRRLARQHERGQLALPLLRHRQGLRLARRPGRDRVHVPRGAERRLRARALRHAVRPQPDGTIYQRPFGGHTANYGEKPVQRACAAADRTGHAMLHTLYQQNVKARTNFFVEWMALDLIRDAEGDVVGVTALEMETGEAAHPRRPRRCCSPPAAPGASSPPRPTPSSTPATAWAWRRAPAIPLEDMEFWQFHPTGVYGAGRAAHRRLPRRGRDPAQQRRRALHGALRADAEGSGAARLRLALHGPGDQGRARLRSAQGPHRPRHDPPRRRHDHEAPAERARDRPQLRQRRHHARADPGRCRRSTTRWAACRPTSTARSWRPRTATRTRWSTACTRSASAPASACTARTGWAPTRCSTCWSSAGPRATIIVASQLGTRGAPALPARRRRLHPGAPGPARREHRRRVRAGRRQRPAQVDAAARRRVPHPGGDGRGRGQVKAIAERAKAIHLGRQVEDLQHRADRGARGRQPDRSRRSRPSISAAARHECRGAHSVADYERPIDDPEFPNGRNDDASG